MFPALPLSLFAACFLTDSRTYPVWLDTPPPDDTAGPDTGVDTDTDTSSDTGTTTVEPGFPAPVDIAFTGIIQSVTGTPFGFDSLLEDTFVSGFFTYDRAVPDDDPDPERGEYQHVSGSGPFGLFFDSHALTGSGNPIVSIDLPDTFGFLDGPRVGDPGGVDRVCAFDTVRDDQILVELSLDGRSGAFVNDHLPATFPLLSDTVATDVTVTFTVEDANGTLVVELDTLE